jgi:Tubulin folding cofactor D C terminal
MSNTFHFTFKFVFSIWISSDNPLQSHPENPKQMTFFIFPGFFGSEKHLADVTACFLSALKEYTLDNRGDIGAWVRETAMNALYLLLTSCPPGLLDPDTVHQTMTGLAQQAVEKIDRTRGLAGKLFCNLVHQ